MTRGIASSRDLYDLATSLQSIGQGIARLAASEVGVSDLIALLRKGIVQDAHGYFVNHRPNNPYCDLTDEYKVQDLLYLLLLPIIGDLQYEDPMSKNVGSLTSTRIDLVSKDLDLLIEAKHASNRHNAKQVEREISEDIAKYGRSGRFGKVLFVVYAYNYSFPKKHQFEIGLTGPVSIGSHSMMTWCVVIP